MTEPNGWLTLTGQTTGTTTTNPQNVVFNVPVNPNSEERTGAIIVRVGDESKGPNGEITVIQKESALSVDEDKTIPAIASLDNTFIFKATKGLSWSVSEEMDWLTLLGTTDGTNNTTLPALSEAENSNVTSPLPLVGLTVISLSVSGVIVHAKPLVAFTEPVVVPPVVAIFSSPPVALKVEPACSTVMLFEILPALTSILPLRADSFGLINTLYVIV